MLTNTFILYAINCSNIYMFTWVYCMHAGCTTCSTVNIYLWLGYNIVYIFWYYKQLPAVEICSLVHSVHCECVCWESLSLVVSGAWDPTERAVWPHSGLVVSRRCALRDALQLGKFTDSLCMCSFTKSWCCFGGCTRCSRARGFENHIIFHIIYIITILVSPAWHKRLD